MIHYKEITHGFEFGSAKVERLHSDKKYGAVVVEIKTPKNKIQVEITKSGKIKIYINKDVRVFLGKKEYIILGES